MCAELGETRTTNVESSSSKMHASTTRVYFRIVKAATATVDDFLPAAALGRRKPKNPDLWRPWAEGVSVYDDVDWARERVADMPRLGSFLAEVVLDESSRITAVQIGNDPSHFVLYGAPDDLLNAVRSVVPV